MAQAPLIIHAPAKLNLCLHIVGRRADGYHLLESLVAFADVADTLMVEPSECISLRVVGEFAELSGDIEHNLVMRAARLLQQHGNIKSGAQITLTKNIPVGAGLGGGSADAAATLHALNRLWQLHLSLNALVALGAPLGADVAMCLHSKPLIAEGVGDVITRFENSLPPMHAVLAYPRAKLLSSDVYQELAGMDNVVNRAPIAGSLGEGGKHKDFMAWLESNTRNDLQQAAVCLLPVVEDVLLAMKGVMPAPAIIRMTGSGACCFALFDNADAAQQYEASLLEAYPQWWVKSCRVL